MSEKHETVNEMTPLVGGRTWLVHSKSILSKYSKNVFVSSKAAIVILFWNFAINLVYGFVFVPSNYIHYHATSYLVSFGIAILLAFSPVAGFLADVKFGRYKTVLYSMWLILAVSSLAVFGSLILLVTNNTSGELGGIIFLVISVLYFPGYCGYNANILQYGLDQLRDAPSQDSVLFLHWYFWFFSCGTFVSLGIYIIVGINSGYNILAAISMIVLSIVVLVISLCVADRKQRWFLIEPGGNNPYKLVYRVVRYASLHKIPVNRSAFTYCEDELPSRLDLGKSKYGGPFTTEQVEDVKVFIGILKVIFLIGPIFMIQTVLEISLFLFAQHDILFFKPHKNGSLHLYGHMVHIEGSVRYIFISNGLLSPLLVVISIPIYLYCIRPYILFHIPGMLKRIGIGMILMILSLMIAFTMDMIVHANHNYKCMFANINHISTPDTIIINESDPPHPPIYMNIYFFIAQHLLSALFNMLVDIAALEFICSQSPYSMKGLLIGTFLSVRAVFQGIAIASTMPFVTSWNIHWSCGSVFYLMHVVVGILLFLVYVCIAKRYKYRMRDEPSHIHRYAEEYYSNIQ